MTTVPNYFEAKKRSVDNLQRLYTVVISLAVTESLRHLLSPLNGGSANWKDWLMFISLIVTLIPFYHGANRYLDATYVTQERSAKHFGLMIDFFMLFIEGLMFFVLAVFINNETVFYTVLSALFLFDIIWVGITNITATGNEDRMRGYKRWASLNFLALVCILISVWSNILNWNFWKTDTVTSIILVLISIGRSTFDYMRVWKFYYPTEMIPAPAPAPLPKGQ